MFSGLTRNERRVLLLLIGVIGVGLAGQHLRSVKRQRVFALTEGQQPRALTAIPPPPQDPPPRPLPQADEKINLNTATAAQLQRLDGIGEKKAQAILEDRAENGPFRSVDDLDRVKGFGAATVGKLRPFLTVGDLPKAAAAAPAPGSGIALAPLGPDSHSGAAVLPDATFDSSASGGPPARGSFPSPTSPTLGLPSSVSPPFSPIDPLGRININTANIEELKALKDIGDVLARRIVVYRTTYGPFRRPEDLMKVKGIGAKTLEKNRQIITVE